MNKYSIAAAVLSILGLIFEGLSMAADSKSMEQDIKEEVKKQLDEALNQPRVVLNPRNVQKKRNDK